MNKNNLEVQHLNGSDWKTKPFEKTTLLLNVDCPLTVSVFATGITKFPRVVIPVTPRVPEITALPFTVRASVTYSVPRYVTFPALLTEKTTVPAEFFASTRLAS